jgi:hypothetical protein
MLVYLCFLVAPIGLVTGYRLRRSYGRRRAAGDPLRRVFRVRELRELDAHLDRVAMDEMLRLDASVVRYVAGVAGHVVAISQSRHGVALGLSDGHRLALGGVSPSMLRRLIRYAEDDKLRPARIDRDSLSYRLLLRGEAGTEIELTTRRVTLAP